MTRSGLLVFLAGLLLVGCADTPRVYNHVQYHSRWPELISWNQKDPVTVMVWGNPFDATQAALDATVAQSMALRTEAQALPVQSNGKAPKGVYISVVFDAAAQPGGYDCLDLDPADLSPAAEGRVKVRMAFCRGGAPLTRVEGEVGNVSSPDDAAFASLIQHMARQLYRGPPTP
jgi:hypothetical protein